MALLGPELTLDVGKTFWVGLGAFVVPFAITSGGDSLGKADGNSFLSCVGLFDAHWEGNEEDVTGKPEVGTGVGFWFGVRLAANEGPVVGCLVG